MRDFESSRTVKEDFDGAWFVNLFMTAPNIVLILEFSASLRDTAISHANEGGRVWQRINWIISQVNSMCQEFRIVEIMTSILFRMSSKKALSQVGRATTAILEIVVRKKNE